MTIYEKPNKDIFAADAPSSEIRPFTAWLRGLGIAFDETNGFPELTSFNGLLQALSIYIKYLEQRGLAEWRNDLEYPMGAGVQVGLSWFKAKQQNLNKPPATSQDDWELLVNASALSYTNPLYVENNVVKIRDATTSQKGVSRFATDTEAQTGAKVSAAITPDQAIMSSFGVNQKNIDVTNERKAGNGTSSTPVFSTWVNNTNKAILVSVSASGMLTLLVDNVVVSRSGSYDWQGSGFIAQVFAVVPPKSSYKISDSFFNSNSLTWTELR